MRIHYSFDQLSDIDNPVVTTGSFDGVHVGHRVILSRLNERAKAIGGESVLITFHPHPRRVLYPEAEGKDLYLINSQAEKKLLLQETELDHLMIVEFTRDFSKTSSIEFVEKYLVGKLQAKVIVVGFNHFFGHNKHGDFAFLNGLKSQYGFDVEEIPHQDILNETVSSTKIRKALREGNIQRANAYLDQFFIFSTILKKDDQKCEILRHDCFGMLKEEDVKLVPADGVYAVSAALSHSNEKGLVHIFSGSVAFFPLMNHTFENGMNTIISFRRQLRPLMHKGSGDYNIEQLRRDLASVEALIY